MYVTLSSLSLCVCGYAGPMDMERYLYVNGCTVNSEPENLYVNDSTLSSEPRKAIHMPKRVAKQVRHTPLVVSDGYISL